MPTLRVVLDGEGQFPEMADRQIIEVHDFAITALPNGMVSGDASVAMIIKLPDGNFVYAETSKKLFLTAADAIRARYGD